MSNPFPVLHCLPELLTALTSHNRACLQAPPGTGKTTKVPPALLQHDGRGVLMLEPRRLAARAAARYMAAQYNESVGRTVGYRVRMDSKVSASTRITVVTEGVLTRMLRDTPDLPTIGWLIFDEFHERHLQGDLGLALALECQETLREPNNPLRILVMSATLDVAPLTQLLGDCPLVQAEGRCWPVTTDYLPPRPHERLEAHVLRGIRAAMEPSASSEGLGSALVFLPGEAEIRRMTSLLETTPLPPATSVHPLYGNLPPEAQDAAIAPPAAGCRKIVLATAIAESSLTIEGVSTVVDAGLARASRFDPGTGMSRLVTGRVSLSGAEQRRGRAGRTGPGRCLRLWDQAEEVGFRPTPRPEMLDADLADLRLELALWGIADPTALRWLDTPPAEGWAVAGALLSLLNALTPAPGHSDHLTDRLTITPHGKAVAALPLHPRMAHMLTRATELERDEPGAVVTACLLAALLDEKDPLRGSAFSVDARLRLEWLARRQDHRATIVARRLQDTLPKHVSGKWTHRINPELAGMLLALAYPDRVAQARGGVGLFRLATGRGGRLPPDDPLSTVPFLAVGEVDGSGPDCRVFQAAPLTETDVRAVFAGHIRTEQVVWWDAQEEAVLARTRETCAELVLRDAPLPSPDPELVDAARLTGFRSLPLSALPWTPELLQWRARVQFLRVRGHTDSSTHGGHTGLFPDLSDAALVELLELWLVPLAQGVNRRNQWGRLDLRTGLLGLFSPHQLHTALQRLDKDAPEHLTVPSGSRIRLEYPESLLGKDASINPTEDTPPILAVKLQEMFGLAQTPRVGGIPVLVHLLSPAGRPLQVTRDLAGFWTGAYAAVRAEMRGRYPRHPWPENPLEAPPTRRLNQKK